MRSALMVLAVVAAATLALATSADDEISNERGSGPEKIIVKKSDPTSSGSFDGTWMYVNRDMRFALWIRTRNGVPQARVQYQSLASPEAFETDWDGKAVYYLAGNPVTFELKLGESNPDRIVGTWSWLLQIGDSARNETADLVLYRTGYGRSLLMDFRNYRKVIRRSGRDSVMSGPVYWTWNKVSKRDVLWDEIPF